MARISPNERARVEQVRDLFKKRYRSTPTANEVLMFWGWLQSNRPDLVPWPKSGADGYQALKTDLYGLWKD